MAPARSISMAPARGITRDHKLKMFDSRNNCETRHRFFSVCVVVLWSAVLSDRGESGNLNVLVFNRGLGAFLGDALFLLLVVVNCVCSLLFSPWAYSTFSSLNLLKFAVWLFL